MSVRAACCSDRGVASSSSDGTLCRHSHTCHWDCALKLSAALNARLQCLREEGGDEGGVITLTTSQLVELTRLSAAAMASVAAMGEMGTSVVATRRYDHNLASVGEKEAPSSLSDKPTNWGEGTDSRRGSMGSVVKSEMTESEEREADFTRREEEAIALAQAELGDLNVPETPRLFVRTSERSGKVVEKEAPTASARRPPPRRQRKGADEEFDRREREAIKMAETELAETHLLRPATEREEVGEDDIEMSPRDNTSECWKDRTSKISYITEWLQDHGEVMDEGEDGNSTYHAALRLNALGKFDPNMVAAQTRVYI